jgi:hypothetical protein
MGKIPEAIRAPLLRRVDKLLAAILLFSLALHFGCVGYLRTLDFPRDAVEVVPRAVTYRPPPLLQRPKVEPPKPERADTSKREPGPARMAKAAPAADPAVRRASLADRMRRQGMLGVITSRGEDGSLADVLKKGHTPGDADEVWKHVSSAATQSSTEVLRPREATGPEIKRGAHLIAHGPEDAAVGDRRGEQSARAPAGKRPEVDPESPTDYGGAMPADPDQAWREVRARLSAIKACYFSAIHVNPGVQGKLVLRLDVAASGEVSHVAFPHDTVHDVGLTLCIRMRASGWKLPSSTGPYHFSVPLVFVTR